MNQEEHNEQLSNVVDNIVFYVFIAVPVLLIIGLDFMTYGMFK